MTSTFDEVTAAQRKREKALIARDRAYAESERKRLEAQAAFEGGAMTAAHDAVDGPTPEQLAHGEFGTFQIDMDKKQSAVSRVGHRRFSTPIIVRMYRNGRLNDDTVRACVWYRGIYDATGLEGSIRIADIGREVFGGGNDGMMFTERQVEAQTAYREARECIVPKYRKFFEAVVLSDIPVRRAQNAHNAGMHPNRTIAQQAERIHVCMDRLGGMDARKLAEILGA